MSDCFGSVFVGRDYATTIPARQAIGDSDSFGSSTRSAESSTSMQIRYLMLVVIIIMSLSPA